MTRREILKYTAYMTGFAVSAPLISALMAGCTAKPADDYKPVFLTPEEYALITALAETTLPASDTPGAAEVGVPAFIDQTVSAIFRPFSRDLFRTRLAALAADCQKANGKSFTELEAATQLSWLNTVDAAAKAEAEKLEDLPPPADEDEGEKRWPFWLQCKELIIGGYFSSQRIGTEFLAYDPVPGDYIGCLPLQEATGGKNWAL